MTDAQQTIQSPRIAALQQALARGGDAALDAFWREMSLKGAPLIEPVASDESQLLVTFVWRAPQQVKSVAVVSNLSGQLGASEPLTHLAGTNLWYRTYRLPNNTRESYQFAVGGENLTDPYNPRQFVFPGDPEIGFSGWASSVLELPDAPKQPWIAARPGVPQGRLDLHRIRYDALDHEYRVWVCTPPGYSTNGAAYGWLLTFDGWLYANLIPTPTILDNLLADRRLPPLVAVLIGHPWDTCRRRDLACYPPFEDFLLRRIIRWARRNFRLTDNPAQTAVVGASLGGTMAAYMGLRHSDIFGNVLTQSGYFGWKPTEGEKDFWIVHQFAAGPILPVRFYVEAGLFETAIPSPLPGSKNFLVGAQHMRDVLLERGYTLHYSEFSGGHNPLNWRGSLADGLLALLGTNAP